MSESAGNAGLKDQLVGLDNRFWIVNVMEMFERLAYYGVRAVVLRQVDVVEGRPRRSRRAYAWAPLLTQSGHTIDKCLMAILDRTCMRCSRRAPSGTLRLRQTYIPPCSPLINALHVALACIILSRLEACLSHQNDEISNSHGSTCTCITR